MLSSSAPPPPVLVAIGITPASASVAAGTTVQLNATGVYSDGSAPDITALVSWFTFDPAATISTGGLCTGQLVGTAHITATLGTITGVSTVTVTAARITRVDVTPAGSTLAAGLTRQFAAVAHFTDQTFQDITAQAAWTSTAAAVASVSTVMGSVGLVTAHVSGDTLVRASLDNVTGETALHVSAAVLQSISVNPAQASIAAGTNQTFTAQGSFSDGSHQDVTAQVAWTSNDVSVASLGATPGLIQGERVGQAIITATLGTVHGNATLDVTAALLTGLSVTPINPSMTLGGTLQLTATASFSDHHTQDVTEQAVWTSGTETLATVSNAAGSRGLVSGLAAGSVDVSAALSGLNAATTVRIIDRRLTSMDVTPASPTLAKGTGLQLMATGHYADGNVVDLTGQVTWNTSDGAVAGVSNAVGSQGVVNAAGVGLANLTATLGLISGGTTITVTAAVLASLNITPAAPTTPAGTDFQLTATGTFTDGTFQDLTDTVTWSSGNGNTATISNAVGFNGLAHGVALGTVLIRAVSGTVVGSTTLNVTNALLRSVAINPVTPSVAKGTTVAFTATGTYSDGTNQDITARVTWASDAAAVDISNAAGSNGLATASLVGSAVISATSGAVSTSTTMTVTDAVLVSLGVTPALASVPLGTNLQFAANGVYSDATVQDLTAQVTWDSSIPANATVSNAVGSQGLLHGQAVGGTQLTATLGSVVGGVSVTVTSAVLTALAVSPAGATAAKGTTQAFTALGTFSDGTSRDVTTQVAWSSSNINAAVISNAAGSSGVATGMGVGSTNIVATSGSVTQSVTFDVTAAVLTHLAVTPANNTLAKGTTLQFTAQGTFSDATTQDLTTQVTWDTGDHAVAQVSNVTPNRGLLLSVGAGLTNVTATLSGILGTTPLTVSDAFLISISVTPATANVPRGLTEQFTATGTYSDGSQQDLTSGATWTSTATAVATVSNATGTQGLATAAASTGFAIITAAVGAINGSALLNATPPVVLAVVVTPQTPLLANGTSTQLTATATYSDGTVATVTTTAVWTSGDAAVASVRNINPRRGEVTAHAGGTVTISAAFGGVTGTTVVTVSSATLTSIAITPAGPISLPRGYFMATSALGTFSDGTTQDVTSLCTWSSDNGLRATVDNNAANKGRIHGIGAGTANISAALNGVTGTVAVTVTNETLQSIALTPATFHVGINGSLQLTAMGTFSAGSVVNITAQGTSWGSSNALVATVSPNGLVTGHGVGTAGIIMSAGGIFGAATATVP